MDWFATVLLVTGYALLAKRPREATLVIAGSDVAWIVYALSTAQVALGLVSAFCGVFAVRAFLTWRPA